jgi:hypothetical protein
MLSGGKSGKWLFKLVSISRKLVSSFIWAYNKIMSCCQQSNFLVCLSPSHRNTIRLNSDLDNSCTTCPKTVFFLKGGLRFYRQIVFANPTIKIDSLPLSIPNLNRTLLSKFLNTFLANKRSLLKNIIKKSSRFLKKPDIDKK